MVKSLIRIAVPVPLALLVLVPLSLAGGDARTEVPEFKRNFAPGMMLSTRTRALERLAEVADVAVLKAFDWALATTRSEVRRLVLEKDEATEEVKRLEKQLDDILLRETQRARERGRAPGQVSVPATLVQSIERGRREITGLQQGIDEEYEVRDFAAEALGTWFAVLDTSDRVRIFRELTRGRIADRDWTVRAFYAKALGGVALPEASRLLLERLADERDHRVLPLLIDAAARQAGEMALPDLLSMLEDERWQIRATVVGALARMGNPAAIPRLIDRLAKEDGRLRGDVAAALKTLTGKDFGVDADRWAEWWEKHRDRFDGPGGANDPGANGGDPEGAPRGETVTFYGIEILSKRVLFVIDISNSMNQAVSAQNQERTKVAVAKYELRTALLSLPEDARFNIVFYHHEVFQWRKGMVEAGGTEKRAAVDFVEQMTAEGNTNIYDALKRAFHIAGLGAHDRNYEVGADTIFFLSDGQPNRGDVTDPGQILAEVRRWNQLRRVKIHTVGVGRDHDSHFMRSLAEASGGEYVKR
jgi:hypothetical protein